MIKKFKSDSVDIFPFPFFNKNEQKIKPRNKNQRKPSSYLLFYEQERTEKKNKLNRNRIKT